MRLLLLTLMSSILGYTQQPIDPLLTEDWKAQEKWVDSIYDQMSIDEKIGQLFMVMAFSKDGEEHFTKINREIKELHLGGIIFSSGGPVRQSKWNNKFQESSNIPLLMGMDAEWGVAMRLDSVKPFPWNMTLGAIKDNRLVEEVGFRIGEQAQRLGIHVNFAPDVDINTNPKNPIIGNRSFGENKYNVADKGVAFIRGMHRAGVLSSAKHFPGHGDTAKDSHLDLPLINFNEERLLETELYPFDRLIEEGVSSVMIGHLNVPALDKGIPSSLSKKIIDQYLIQRMNYKGLIITDALNMGGASEVSKINSVDVAAFLAGNDILLIPADVRKAIKKMKRAFKQKKFSEARLAHSVKKILKAKYKVGLSNWIPVDTNSLQADLNSPLDDYLIYKSMSEAITLVHKNATLPTEEEIGLISLGDADGEVFYQHLANTRKIRRYKFNGDLKEAKSVFKKNQPIVIGFHRSNASPWKASSFSKKQIELIKFLAEDHPIFLVAFVKPYALSALGDLSNLSLVMMSYQNNEPAQRVSAKMLLGEMDIRGTLPVSINDQIKEGSGWQISSDKTLDQVDPFLVGIDAKKIQRIDDLAKITLDSLMTPGFQILASRNGKVFYHKAFGHHTYENKRIVQLSDLYDVASLTKVLVTLPLLIQEVDQGKMSLESTLGEMSHLFKGTNKDTLTFKETLSHQSGIIPWVPFYKSTLRKRDGKRLRKYYRKKSSKRFNIRVADNIYGHTTLSTRQLNALIESKLIEKGYHYSDLPFIFFQHILEQKHQKGIEDLVQDRLFSPLGLTATQYLPLLEVDKHRIIPSEDDNYFRNQRLQGEVHDMTAALQGGISGHAGLFSNAKEVATLMQMYLQKGYYGGQQFFSSAAFDQFNNCYYCEDKNRRGVGLDKPQLWGGGMTFQGISPESFGHAGFTGTFAWADPDKQVVFVFLSNRTFPTMENRKLIDHNIRTRMLKLIYDAILY